MIQYVWSDKRVYTCDTSWSIRFTQSIRQWNEINAPNRTRWTINNTMYGMIALTKDDTNQLGKFPLNQIDWSEMFSIIFLTCVIFLWFQFRLIWMSMITSYHYLISSIDFKVLRGKIWSNIFICKLCEWHLIIPIYKSVLTIVHVKYVEKVRKKIPSLFQMLTYFICALTTIIVNWFMLETMRAKCAYF